MAHVPKPRLNIWFETKAQKQRIQKAAKLRKWSTNQFIIDAAEKEVAKLMATGSNGFEQITKSSDQLTLNQ